MRWALMFELWKRLRPLPGAANCRGLPPSTAGHPRLAWFHISSLQARLQRLSPRPVSKGWVQGPPEKGAPPQRCEDACHGKASSLDRCSCKVADYLAQVRKSILECRRSSSSAEFAKCGFDRVSIASRPAAAAGHDRSPRL